MNYIQFYNEPQITANLPWLIIFMLVPHPAAVSNRVSTSQSARSEAFLLAAPRFWPPSQRVKISSQRTVKLISYRLRPGFFWFTGVQTQAWTNSLLNLPKPQSKRTFIFKAATHQRKKQPIYFFRLMDMQTQAWTNSLLHVPKPQSKQTFIFTAAAHKQRSNIAAFALHVGKIWDQ